jgi:hypothetical protein
MLGAEGDHRAIRAEHVMTPVELAHPRVVAYQDGLAGSSGYARGDRGEARDRDDAQTRRVRESLHHPGAIRSPVNAPGPRPKARPSRSPSASPASVSKAVDEGQDEIGMAALGQRLAQGQRVGREQRD